MKERREYTKEFKESAIELVRSNRKSAKAVADDLGISPANVRRWLKESEEEKKSNLRSFPGRGNVRDEEIARLKKENADLKETNEILKKAMTIFAVKKP